TISMSAPLVVIDHFRMDFGKKTVIQDLSFDIRVGETFGLLGSNGSGKTTIIRALLGIYQATAGVLHIDGRPFVPEHSKGLGYLPEERGLYKKESVIDVMVYFGKLKGLNRENARKWSIAYLERVGLGDKAKVRVDKLSSGQQQKVQLGVTIMNSPELLILDEPTKGFDPVNRRLLMNIVEDQKKAGATVLLVTHQMEEVERLCDRIILLKDGVSRAYGSVEEVQSQFGNLVIHIDHDGPIPTSTSYNIVETGPGHSKLEVPEAADAADILREIVSAGINVQRFAPSRKSLDDIFVEVYGDENEKEE
ncbi:MAG TPA: ATP-binding cassette domain-containing protein, partial [Candidatus Nanopelagicaceae bacterium]